MRGQAFGVPVECQDFQVGWRHADDNGNDPGCRFLARLVPGWKNDKCLRVGFLISGKGGEFEVDSLVEG